MANNLLGISFFLEERRFAASDGSLRYDLYKYRAAPLPFPAVSRKHMWDMLFEYFVGTRRVRKPERHACMYFLRCDPRHM